MWYDALLRLEMKHGVFLHGYSDHVATVISARPSYLTRFRLDQAMIRVGKWKTSHGLELATEVVMVTRRKYFS